MTAPTPHLPQHCHWIKDPEAEGGEFMIPHCIGGAVYGMGGCTCHLPLSRYDQAVARGDRAENKLADLRKEIGSLRKEIDDMRITNRRLRKAIADHKRYADTKPEVQP